MSDVSPAYSVTRAAINTQQGLEVIPASRLGPNATDTPWRLIEGSTPSDIRIQSPLGILTVESNAIINQGAHVDVSGLVEGQTKQTV